MKNHKIKIYLSYKQIETLCFSKVVLVPSDQLKVTRSKMHCEFTVFIDEGRVVTNENKLTILFSSVSEIQIPESEYNLFKNQFRLPLGLISPITRSVPNDSDEELSYYSSEDYDIFSLYSKLRRSLTQVVLFCYNNEHRFIQNNFQRLINKLVDMPQFAKDLIRSIHKEGCFPSLQVKSDAIKPDEYFMYAWWGKFVIESILEPQKSIMTDEEYKSHKAWLRKFDFHDLSENVAVFKKTPKHFVKDTPIIIGYFLAAMSYAHAINTNIGESGNVILRNIGDVDNKYEILFWGILFQAFFLENLDYVYPNTLIQEDFSVAEELSLNLSKMILNITFDKNLPKYEYKRIDSDQLLIAYVKLKGIGGTQPPTIITRNDIFSLFSDSDLFQENRRNIGFVNRHYGKNYILIEKDDFILECDFTSKPITFFGPITKEQKEKLRNAGVSIRSRNLEAIIPKTKKVIVGFFDKFEVENSELFNIYKEVIQSNKSKIKKSGYPVYSTEYHILWLTTYYLGARNRIACYSMLHQTVKKQATRL